MDAETYMKLELLLATASMGLFLTIVWVVMQIIKSKARFIHYLQGEIYARRTNLTNR